MPRTLLVAPAGRAAGLTTATLGLLRALDRQGARVAFAKPIATRAEDRSLALVKLGSSLQPPDPLPYALVEDLLSDGDDQTLMGSPPMYELSWLRIIERPSRSEPFGKGFRSIGR